MGSMSSRLSFEAALQATRQRSQQDEIVYSYSLNKNRFSNYFIMGGDRFEVNDPDYLFGDTCDLNFLSCTKPCSLPYKKAQQDLLANLNTKQKTSNKVSSRIDRLSSPLNIFSGRRIERSNLRAKQQDAQTQTSKNGAPLNGFEPSKPLVMLINIRKESLRIVKSTTARSSTRAIHPSYVISKSTVASPKNQNVQQQQQPPQPQTNHQQQSKTHTKPTTAVCKLLRRKSSASKSSRRNSAQYNQSQHSSSRHSTVNSRATTINPNDDIELRAASLSSRTGDQNPLAESSSMSANLAATSSFNRADAGSIASGESSCSTKSGGYTSVKDAPMQSENNSANQTIDGDDTSSNSSGTDEEFKDALNDTINISIKSEDGDDYEEDDDDESERLQQRKSLLLNESANATNDVKITIEPQQTDESLVANNSDNNIQAVDATDGYFDVGDVQRCHGEVLIDENGGLYLGKPIRKKPKNYNFEFRFDSEVECSIRIYYFCTREFTSNGITYKPQQVAYKSKIYNYKKGLNQSFDQKDHLFTPQIFDENLLAYKPLDTDGNFNASATFPVVIHIVAMEGPLPRQSQSLVATIEKTHRDDGYTIKPLKQIIFADGVQYILQDIYGIEHKRLEPGESQARRVADRSPTLSRASSSASLHRNLSTSNQSHLNAKNYYDTVSLRSSIEFTLDNRDQARASFVSTSNQNRIRSLASDPNAFECVICMSEERDTMLLPCRHLCLCCTCAQSLRFQANSCPICRCPFKAALNLRPMSQRRKSHENTRLRPLGDRTNQRSRTQHHKSSSSLKTKLSTDAVDSTSSRNQIAETNLSVTPHAGSRHSVVPGSAANDIVNNDRNPTTEIET